MVMQMKGWDFPTLVQFVWIKHLRHNKYAVSHAQCLRPKVEAARQQEIQSNARVIFDKTTDKHMYMAIRYQHKVCTMNVYFCLKTIIDKVLTSLRQKFF